MNSDSSILGYFRFLLASWKMIALCSLITASVTAGINLWVLKPVYRAEATVLPRKDSGPEAGMLASLGQLGGLAGAALSSGRSADFAEILNSRKMRERLITRFNLEKRLTGWKTRSELLEKIKRATVITTPSLKNNVLTVQFNSADSTLAAEVANGYVDELGKILNEIGYSQAAKSARFLRSQLDRTKNELSVAESKLAAFQTKNRLVSLPDTVKAAIGTLSQLETQGTANSISLEGSNEELGAVEKGVGSLQMDPSSLVQLRLKRRALEAQQAAIQKARAIYLDRLAGLPPQALELARLEREVQIQNAVYMVLTQQYESALIAEAKDSEAFLPLDPALPPEDPIGPKKTLNTLIGALGGAMVGVLLSLAISLRPQIRGALSLPAVSGNPSGGGA